jgi:hypothetical protein
MNRLPATIVIAGGLLANSMVYAADRPHSFAAKRQFASQVIGCMKKRMAADRYISYNEAAKVCKEQVNRQFDSPDQGPLVAADVKH